MISAIAFLLVAGAVAQPLKAIASAPVMSESLSLPGKVAVNPDGRIIVIADTGHNRIVVASLSEAGDTATVQDIIGDGIAALKDGSFTEARFNHPQGICIDGMIYVADTLNHALRMIDLERKEVTTLAGNGQQAPLHPGTQLKRKSELNFPWDVAQFGPGDYAIAMAGSHQIWAIHFDSPNIDQLIGSGREDLIDGPVTSAALAQPSGIAVADRTIYIADAASSSIRKVHNNAGYYDQLGSHLTYMSNGKLVFGRGDRVWQNPMHGYLLQMGSGQIVPRLNIETLIGKGLSLFGDIDGLLEQAQLHHPLGVAAMPGFLFIADSYNHKIKCLDLKGKTIRTLAGSGKSGYKNGSKAQFAEPGGLALDKQKIYVADTKNSVIRVISSKSGSLTDPKAKISTSTLKLIWK